VRNNVIYLANLAALESWYRGVRRPFFAQQEFGDLGFDGALALLAGAKDERIKRLHAMAAKVPAGNRHAAELTANLDALAALFAGPAAAAEPTAAAGEAFLAALRTATAGETSYIKGIKSLDAGLAAQGVEWLQSNVDDLCERAAALLPSLGICVPGNS